MASGLIAGALLGFLVRELGLWPIKGWDVLSIKGLLAFAIVGALASLVTLVRRALYVMDVALLCAAGVVGMTPLMSIVVTRWIRADSLPATPLDAVVVLSSSVTSGGTLNETGTDRLVMGLELMRRGVAPRLFTTRVTVRALGMSITTDADQARLVAVAGFTPQWTQVGESQSTHDEASAVDRRLRALDANRVAVVTSPMHTRRACATFEALGMRVTCVPALERAEQTRRPRSSRDRLGAFKAYLYERLAWWLYRRRGWVRPT
jgi:uncharacterized SAM-binding protein YcdF (DUF218 family)